MKDPYKVLGLDSSATDEQLQAKYDELLALYSEQRFAAGEVGNEGARKLAELNDAWDAITASKVVVDSVSDDSDEYAKVDELIRAEKYNEAQDVLDSIQNRKGEWHYMQAIVFYKRDWLSDAKTQLEMALRDDPNNPKYNASLDKLKIAMGVGAQERQAQEARQAAGGYAGNPQGEQQQNPMGQAGDMGNCLSSCCCAYCLTDCLCSAMRCC